MDLNDIKRGLRAEIKKRENEQYLTFQCNVRQMCTDVLAKLEEQEEEINSLRKQVKELHKQLEQKPKEVYTVQYVARFYEDEGGISVEFPDIPGVYTCADTMDEAKKCAEKALNGVLKSILRLHAAIPLPKVLPDENKGFFPVPVRTNIAEAIIKGDRPNV